MKLVLMDIEGTTTPIDFVHKTLFPYSAKHLPDFVRDHRNETEVAKCLEQVAATVKAEKGETIDDPVPVLLQWIDEDRKHPALKSLQGLVWKHGYETGAFVSEIYDDVLPAIDRWRKSGVELGIYSSGSVRAQKLLFGHTPHGDLTNRFRYFFDTAVGGKKEAASYHNILQQLARPASEVLFLSDVGAELDAAKENGIATVQLVRPGTEPVTNHETARTFADDAIANWIQ